MIIIERSNQIQPNDIKSVDDHRKRLDVVDILKNSTRFMIHGLLSIYPELSLTELKQMTGKSKATLVEHLKEMIHSNLVKVSKEEVWRGSMMKKWYSLTPEADEETELVGRKHSDKSPEESLIDKIDTHISFAQTKSNLLKNWTEYLDCLKDKIKNGQFKEVEEVMNEMKQNHEIFTTSSYYSLKHAHQFVTSNWKTYAKLENARREEAGLPIPPNEDNGDSKKHADDEEMKEKQPGEGSEIQSKDEKRKERPYFASVDLIPIKRVFDFKAKQYIKTRESKK